MKGKTHIGSMHYDHIILSADGRNDVPLRVLVSNIGDSGLQLVEVSQDGKLKSLGKAQIGKAPKRVAFLL